MNFVPHRASGDGLLGGGGAADRAHGGGDGEGGKGNGVHGVTCESCVCKDMTVQGLGRIAGLSYPPTPPLFPERMKTTRQRDGAALGSRKFSHRRDQRLTAEYA